MFRLCALFAFVLAVTCQDESEETLNLEDFEAVFGEHEVELNGEIAGVLPSGFDSGNMEYLHGFLKRKIGEETKISYRPHLEELARGYLSCTESKSPELCKEGLEDENLLQWTWFGDADSPQKFLEELARDKEEDGGSNLSKAIELVKEGHVLLVGCAYLHDTKLRSTGGEEKKQEEGDVLHGTGDLACFFK
ncbi:unnamed protein product [Cylicocyclus nassatus]|uniref:Uncharacterized protein n=1 Tax=Cylicocyclus nassatus TaxID=53992 RepID=A0AA36H0J2_CYLNA|nr:unnamed protein product [Cylicocyclus nassatus]